jgi:hypothetical protein
MEKSYSKFMRSFVAVTITAMLVATGCFTLRTATRSDLTVTEKTAFVLHSASQVIRLNTVMISDGKISGLINPSVTATRGPNTVHVFIAPDSAIKRNGLMVEVPMSNVAKVEIPKFDAGKTLINSAIVTGAAAATFVAIILIAKGVSCPFIYENTENGYQFSGEIYSGATAIPLEREDWFKLEKLKPVSGKYSLKISNEVNEIQNTNLAELFVIDHKSDKSVIIDRNGIPFASGEFIAPVSATNVYGSSVLSEVEKMDSIRYITPVKNDDIVFDTLTLTFDIPDPSGKTALIIRAKNTMWLDYSFGEFTDMFGNRYEKWKELRNKKSYSDLIKNSLDQGIPLKIYATVNNKPAYIDFFNLPGPMADRELAMIIDPEYTENGRLTLKLTSGVLFWDFDMIRLAVVDESKFSSSVIEASTAIDETGRDVKSLLSAIDDNYLVQPEPGNITELTFDATEVPEGMTRTLFLHSSGHYEVLRNPKGKADIAYLKTFNQPGTFTKFSKDRFLNFRLSVAN